MGSERKTILYQCTGTQERFGFGYTEGHKYLIYDMGEELHLSFQEAVGKYGNENVQIHPTDGSICPDCCDIAVTLGKLRKHGINVVEIIQQLKSKNS